MPTANERIANKALTGEEVKQILRKDFEKMIAGEGLLNEYTAYHRLGYRLSLTLHMDNPATPKSVTTVESKPEGKNTIEAHPELAAIQSVPLQEPSANLAVSGTELTRNIESPNEERVRHGLEVTMEVKQPDRTVTQEKVTYPPDAALGDGDVAIRSVSKEERAEFYR